MQNVLIRRTVTVIFALFFVAIAAGLLIFPPLLDSDLSGETIVASRIAAVIYLGAGIIWLCAFRWVAPALQQVTRDSGSLWRVCLETLRHWQRSTSSAHAAALFFILVVGVVLRLNYLDQPMRTDESLTVVQYASAPLYMTVSDYSAPNNHVLHSTAVWLSLRLLGDSHFAIRLTAFLSGILTIPLTYILARRLTNRHAALLAAGLVATAGILIEYSVNARGYTLQTVLFLSAFTAGIVGIFNANRAGFVLLAIFSAAGFFTVPTMLYAYGGMMLTLLVMIIRQTNNAQRLMLITWWTISGFTAAALTLMLYTPVFVVSGISALTGNVYVQSMTFAGFIESVPRAFGEQVEHWHRGMLWIVGLVLAVGQVVYLFVSRSRRNYVPITLVYVVWIAGVLLVQRVAPFPRVWLPLLPIYLLTCAAGLIYLLRATDDRRAISAAMLLLAVNSASVLHTGTPYWSIETGTFRDAEAVTEFLEDRLVDGTKVIHEHTSRESLRFYFMREGLPDEQIIPDGLVHDTIYIIVNREYPQTAESVMSINHVDPTLYTEPELMAEFPLSQIYRIERLTSIPEPSPEPVES